MQYVPFSAVKPEGFWERRIRINKESTIPTIYKRFNETGRFAAAKCVLGEGMPQPHIFWDSDVAKWIEACAYSLTVNPDPALEKQVDEIIDDMAGAQLEDGYYNCYYIPCELENRFTNRDHHELYCAGHLTEAAVAYCKATGKDKLLNMMKKYLDLIEKIFMVEDSAAFCTPGHEEIELALVKIYELTGDEKYKNLCAHFINARGCREKDVAQGCWSGDHSYDQTHLPVRKQKEAKGHSVRALYLFSGMADLARLTGDEELISACKTLFENISTKRMYVTGGVGSSSRGETFTQDYDLPNDMAYSETCASIALEYFCRRMLALDIDSKYADAAERAIYNCILGGVSLDGRSFFYVNPLEINLSRHERYEKWHDIKENLLTQRVEVFSCSCCPPNLARIIASFAGDVYGYDDNTIYAHHFMAGEAEWDGIKIKLDTRYPNFGDVRFTLSGAKGKKFAVRIPGWCRYATLNGEKLPHAPVKGYLCLDVTEDEQVFDFYFEMKPRFVAANPETDGDNGKVCVMKGPLVYCAESVINGGVNLCTVSLDTNADIGSVPDEESGGMRLTAKAFIDNPHDELYFDYNPEDKTGINLTLLPYYAYANHGESDMQVWLRVK
ncbi:MAG: glycoside hydrolase family 127 protein [Clostridia bacterium]|nr:glycoside hydrolase family 127 protein [Clostridia bacterium]